MDCSLSPGQSALLSLHRLWGLSSSTGTWGCEFLFMSLLPHEVQSSSEGRGEDVVIWCPQSKRGAQHGGSAQKACLKNGFELLSPPLDAGLPEAGAPDIHGTK